jgi:DNA-binding CsgD family transcriptional regulator
MDARIDDKNAVLRAKALQARSQESSLSLHDAWQRLARGDWKIIDAFTDETTCYLLLIVPRETAPAIGSLRLQILEHVLRGDRQKMLAIELGMPCSTIAAAAKQALACLGLTCLPSRVPLALAVVAQGSDGCRARLVAGIARFHHEGREYHVVSIRRPDHGLTAMLPPAEADVLRARIEGHSHRNIADGRRKSPRTIANQLASASRRLGVSGRLEIIGKLVMPGSDAMGAPPRVLGNLARVAD